MSTITELKWSSLTAAVNEIKSPNQFLKRMLYSNHDPKSTEDIEIGLLSRGREIAPFVRKNGEALLVGTHTETFQTVAPPNIRIKRPFTPSELLFGRRPGTPIFNVGGKKQISAVRKHIARDIQGMANMITNAEEYLCSQTLQGAISYEVEDAEVYTITFPRPSGNNITLSVFWNDADPTLPRPLKNIHAVKRVMSQEVGLSPTDAVLGTEAADAILELTESTNIKLLGQRGFEISAGHMTFIEKFSDDGVVFLGHLGGVRLWEYGRTADLNGVSTPMVRPKYAEFFSTSAASDRVLYYGAIADMEAINEGKIAVERFSKSWIEKDPSRMMALVNSRPLPVPRRPAATVSVKVVSG